MKRVCVFCGSSHGKKKIYTEIAQQFGVILAQRKIGLVYGGGEVGLMGEIANAVLHAGGEVIGVIPKALALKEVAHEGLTKMHVVDDMLERKKLMIELSDGFVALPGGFGTLDELFEALTWAQLGFHNNPCAVLEVDGYYQQLLAFLDLMTEQQFLKPVNRQMLLVETNPETLLNRLESYKAPNVKKWIDREGL